MVKADATHQIIGWDGWQRWEAVSADCCFSKLSGKKEGLEYTYAHGKVRDRFPLPIFVG